MGQVLSIFSALYPLPLIALIALAIALYRSDIKNEKSGFLILLFFGTLISYFVSFFGNYEWETFMIAWIIRDVLIFYFGVKIWEFFFLEKRFFLGIFSLFTIGLGVLFYQNGSLNIIKPNSFQFDDSAELLFDIKNVDDLLAIKSLLSDYNAEIVQAFPQINNTSITALDDYYTIDVDNSLDLEKIIEKLKKSGLIDWVEDNETYQLPPVEISTTQKAYKSSMLNDAHASKIWSLNHTDITDIKTLLKNLKKQKPTKKAKIFILDTGVDANHEDLEDNYFSINSTYDKDTNKHGTHCAGVACAVTNNKKGIASLNLTGEFTSVTSITVLPRGRGTQESIIDGMILAADNGADVISMSLGSMVNPTKQKAYNEAIKYANDKGAIVVVAAGNARQSAMNFVPASCDGVITVSAIDEELNKASFSNHVSDVKYKIAAPGVNIYSTTPGNKYESMNGTSMATPFVAAVLGIMKSIQPDLSTKEAYTILNSTGIDTQNTELTGKCIQPAKAIASVKSKGIKSSTIRFLDKLVTFNPQK